MRKLFRTLFSSPEILWKAKNPRLRHEGGVRFGRGSRARAPPDFNERRPRRSAALPTWGVRSPYVGGAVSLRGGCGLPTWRVLLPYVGKRFPLRGCVGGGRRRSRGDRPTMVGRAPRARRNTTNNQDEPCGPSRTAAKGGLQTIQVKCVKRSKRCAKNDPSDVRRTIQVMCGDGLDRYPDIAWIIVST